MASEPQSTDSGPRITSIRSTWPGSIRLKYWFGPLRTTDVVEADAVDQHQHLLARQAANERRTVSRRSPLHEHADFILQGVEHVGRLILGNRLAVDDRSEGRHIE